jgi:hypothetical protein
MTTPLTVTAHKLPIKVTVIHDMGRDYQQSSIEIAPGKSKSFDLSASIRLLIKEIQVEVQLEQVA